MNFEQALQIAGDQFSGAVLNELDLDSDNDVVRWELELYDGQGVTKEFGIDTATGAVFNQR